MAALSRIMAEAYRSWQLLKGIGQKFSYIRQMHGIPTCVVLEIAIVPMAGKGSPNLRIADLKELGLRDSNWLRPAIRDLYPSWPGVAPARTTK